MTSRIQVKDKIDLSTAQGKMYFQLLSILAEFELETIKVRLLEVRLAKMRKKEIFPCKRPYGYTWNDVSKSLEIVQNEKDIFDRIVNDYLYRRYSITCIAHQLNEEHVQTRTGARWSSVVVSELLRNPLYYTGQFGFHIFTPEEERIHYVCEPLITHSVWKRIQPLIDDSKSKSGRPTKAIDTFLLYGLLRCGLCGTRLATSYGTKRKDASSLRIYLCNHQKMNMRRLKSRGIEKCNLPRVDAETIEKGVWNYLRTFFFYMDEKVEGAVEDKWKPKLEQAEQKVENIRKEKKRLEIGLANTESLRFEKEFPKVRYLRQVAELTQQLSQIDWELKEAKNELLEIKEMISNEQSVIEFASGNPDIFEQILQCIETLPFSGKQKLLKGMLVEPIKVFSSTAYMPVFSFNQLILQEILSEYCPNINSKHRFQGPCAFA